jgi:hypothetical protein
MATTQMSTGRNKDKQIVIYSNNGIPFINKKNL